MKMQEKTTKNRLERDKKNLVTNNYLNVIKGYHDKIVFIITRMS